MSILFWAERDTAGDTTILTEKLLVLLATCGSRRIFFPLSFSSDSPLAHICLPSSSFSIVCLSSSPLLSLVDSHRLFLLLFRFKIYSQKAKQCIYNPSFGRFIIQEDKPFKTSQSLCCPLQQVSKRDSHVFLVLLWLEGRG